VLIACAFSGLLYSSSSQLGSAKPIDWKNVVLWQVIIYGWAILFPLIVFFAVRVRFERDNWWKVLPLHLLAATVFILLHDAIFVTAHYFVEPDVFVKDRSFVLAIGVLFVRNWTLDLAMYSFILSTVYVVDYYRRFQAERLRSSELKAALSHSELQTLKMQLHPHFLFNTLNTISALMHEDVHAADTMVARLGDFLRMTLENPGDHEVPLWQEMEFIDAYLGIERVRFGDRLTITRDIDDEALEACVPNLILQPLIENAIKHGISRVTGEGRLAIRAKKIGERLLIEVEDNGPASQPWNGRPKPVGSGIGLANTHARLRHVYHSDYSFELGPAVPHGTLATIEIPFVLHESGLLQEMAFTNDCFPA
jgi:signal transduction histidine kinase